MTTAPMWVRVGGGMESIPDHHRHGPADVDFPPPGGPWEALILNGRVVGWADEGGLRAARHSAELGEQLVEQHRDHLLGRLGHKLRSSVLALQESARQAAFGRPELLEAVFELAQEVGRRAAALEAAVIQSKDGARGVVLGAVLNLAVPTTARHLPADAVVLGSEPALVEAFARARDWVGAHRVELAAACGCAGEGRAAPEAHRGHAPRRLARRHEVRRGGHLPALAPPALM